MNITGRAKHKLIMIFTAAAAAALLTAFNFCPDIARGRGAATYTCHAATEDVYSGYTAASYISGIPDINEIYVRLKHDTHEYVYRYPDIEYTGGIDKAFKRGYQKDFRGRLVRRTGDMECSYALKGLRDKLKSIAHTVYCEPIDAKVAFCPDSRQMFEITPDIKGRQLDIDGLEQRICSALSRGKSYDGELIFKDVKARYSAADIKLSTGLRQEFATFFPASTAQRRHNIALSLSFINGTVLAPGESFSFNETVGARTAERGFRDAKIIVNGQFVDGIGGGVCQASTTLYNAALLAGLNITQQHRHSLAVSYVKPSFDAMVNSGSADLKFKNDTEGYIFIKAFVKDSGAYIRIYGHKNPYKPVRRSVVTKVYPAPAEKLITDTEGKYPEIYAGMRKVVYPSKPKIESEGYIDYYKDGKLAFSRRVRKDVYGELVGLEVIGTCPKPEPPSELPQQ